MDLMKTNFSKLVGEEWLAKPNKQPANPAGWGGHRPKRMQIEAPRKCYTTLYHSHLHSHMNSHCLSQHSMASKGSQTLCFLPNLYEKK